MIWTMQRARVPVVGAVFILACARSHAPSGDPYAPAQDVPQAAAAATTSVPPASLRNPEPRIESVSAGVVHRVKRGETLYRIAKRYGVPVRELLEINHLRDARDLKAGSEILIPRAAHIVGAPPSPPGIVPRRAEPQTPLAPATKPLVAKEPGLRSKKALQWPVKGVLYSGFGVRQGQRHDGIDIAAPEGTPIGAAADGTVVYTGWQAGYGKIVLLRHETHGNLLTLYAHTGAILVREGSRVKAGQLIAKVGQSGRTTGPHLHFEVREGTQPRNPLLYLP